MKQALPYFLALIAIFLVCLPAKVSGQCMSVPVPIEQRTSAAAWIVRGHVIDQHCYIDANGSVSTINIFEVDAYLKNPGTASRFAIITLGGVLNDRATVVNPALQLEREWEYVLFLEGDNHQIDDPQFRQEHPEMVQTLTYADAQGALTYQFGQYRQAYFPAMTEQELFDKLEQLTGQTALSPQLVPVLPRHFEPITNKILAITGFAPNPSNAGTIVIGDFLAINGSGFGAAAGTVFYSNADDGGATFTSSGVASDNVSWTSTDITNKIARRAGTGPINVNGAMTSGSNLTVNYSHIDINSTFSGFGSSTRQRYYLRNVNGAGGYYFMYNTTSGFSADAAAVAAFERALETWRCATFINWFSNGSTATGFGNDGNCVVLYDLTLPVGVLGRATSQFSGSATGACNLANTVWWCTEIDVQFQNPPAAGFTWEKGPALPSLTEFDMESVALHELGHAHGLGHRIAGGQCMHFSISNGTAIRTLNVNEINGGLSKMAYSTAATCFNPAGSGTPMTALTAGTCILPAQFLVFSGEYQEGTGNVLHWTTHAEFELPGYFVERSRDGNLFESLGYINATGGPSTAASYAFTDEANLIPGAYLYRLRMVDQNGTTTYSNIIEIQTGNLSGPGLYFDKTNERLLVTGIFDFNAPLEIRITGIDGRLLYIGNDLSIPADSWPSGIYAFEIRYSGILRHDKVLVY